MTRPRLLDLFCGAVGYHRGGYDVTGVDIQPQPDYPFDFHRADALEFAAAHWHEFDAVHASPPCQHDCTLTAGTNAGRVYPSHTTATQALLRSVPLPHVIENPAGRTPLRRDLVLCGEMFDLAVIRHRVFELSDRFRVGRGDFRLDHKHHRGRVAGMRHGEWFTGPYFAVYGEGGGKGTVAQWQAAMGIDWTEVRKSIAEAIPPAYTEHIGRRLLERTAATTTEHTP